MAEERQAESNEQQAESHERRAESHQREAEAQGTSGEAIGRPGPWGESRYEKKDQPIDQSVLTPPGSSPPRHKPVSTPVTRRDYTDERGPGEGETAGGDAG